MKISENTILITGGTSGIGREFVNQFYGLNNKIIVASSNSKNLRGLKIEYPKIEIIIADLSERDAVDNLIKCCLNKYQDINVILNNAGIQINTDWFEDRNGFNEIEREIAVNLMSPMCLIHGLLPLLMSKEESAIINISSALAFAPKKSAPIYCGTKAAIHAATKALRYQFESTRIKVFEIIPPLVDISMTKGRVTGKMPTQKLVKRVLKKLQKDTFEISIGKARILRLIQRVLPKVADNILKNG